MLDSVRRISALVPAVSLPEAKAQLRVTWDEEDALISSLVGTATDYCERVTRSAFGQATYRATFTRADWPSRFEFAAWTYLPFGLCPMVMIPRPPFVSLQAVNLGGVTLDPSGYATAVNRLGARLMLKNLSLAQINEQQPLSVDFTAGDAVVSALQKQAVLLLASHWYENRIPVNIGNIVNDLPHSLTAILSNLRTPAPR